MGKKSEKSQAHIFYSDKPSNIRLVLEKTLADILGQGDNRSFRRLVSDSEFSALLRKGLGFVSGTYGLFSERGGKVSYVDLRDTGAITIPRYLSEWDAPNRWNIMPFEARPLRAKELGNVEDAISSEFTTSMKACRALRMPGTYPLTIMERGEKLFLAEEGELWLLYIEKRIREILTEKGYREAVSFCRSESFIQFVDERLWRPSPDADRARLREKALRLINSWLQRTRDEASQFAEWKGRLGSWFVNPQQLALKIPVMSWLSLGELVCEQANDGLPLQEWLRSARVHVAIAQEFQAAVLLVFTYGPLMDENGAEGEENRSEGLRGFFVGAFCDSEKLKRYARDVKTVFSLLGQHNLMRHVIKRTVRAEQDRYMGATTAVLAHKLKEPVTYSGAYVHKIEKIAAKAVASGLALSVEDSGKVVGLCSKALGNLDSLDLFVDRFLNYARAGVRKDEHVKLSELVSRAAAERKAILSEIDATININVPPDLTCFGDSTALVEVFVNLIENAAHAVSGQETREISIVGEMEDLFAVILVTDSGRGIPEGSLTRIFEPGVHLRGSQDGLSRPTGMGLALSRRLIEAQHGKIEARPPGSGVGAEFVVRLPS